MTDAQMSELTEPHMLVIYAAMLVAAMLLRSVARAVQMSAYRSGGDGARRSAGHVTALFGAVVLVVVGLGVARVQR